MVALLSSLVIQQTLVPWSVNHPGEMDIKCLLSILMAPTTHLLLPVPVDGREKKGRRPWPLLKQGHLLLGSWENVSETRAPLEPSFPPQLDSDNCISQSGHKGALPPLYFKYT